MTAPDQHGGRARERTSGGKLINRATALGTAAYRQAYLDAVREGRVGEAPKMRGSFWDGGLELSPAGMAEATLATLAVANPDMDFFSSGSGGRDLATNADPGDVDAG